LEDAAPASPLVCRLNTIPEWRQPWEIYVNSSGERFVREDGDSIDDRERSLFHQPGMTAWMVFDQAIMDAAPPRYRKWYGAYETPPRDPFDGSLWAFSKADTITALAARAGIDPDGLAQTIHAFNSGEDGEPDALGRRHRPLPIAQPPFYAIRFQGCSVFSAAGLSVNDRLEVLGPGGAPLPNLYAAGEILGSWQTMGQGNSGGMMATPALTFGRLLGERIMRW
ncbi:MAG: FAD-binding protein, partial [Pseudomonadota bacterium]